MYYWCGLICSLLLSGSVSASNTEYNVAKGLAPASNQSIQTLKPFEGQFRILGYKFYHDDEQAKFSPVDLAVSSGLFADPQIASQISVQQYDRYLKWSIPYLPVPAKQAIEMVFNIHFVPASPEIAQQIKQIKRGDLVHLQGELIEINDKNLVWKSSLSRDDVGDGACEVFRVNEIQWLEKQREI
ncbi:hypothetical protein F4V57_07205 [Acinetobacter qingfengensis]|nr:hypothetical protein [Acinetobacter qingfengensis]KAA8733938.1 hypothetical protein F4V57_07205 [Acinetobacter qingfengensis]